MLNPEDIKEFKKEILSLSKHITVNSDLTIIEDFDLDRGECVFATISGTVDMSLTEGINLVRESLLQGESLKGENYEQ